MTVKGYFAKGHWEEGFRLLFSALEDILLDAFGLRETRKNNAAFGKIDPT